MIVMLLYLVFLGWYQNLLRKRSFYIQNL